MPEVTGWAIERIVTALPDELLAGQLLVVGIENDDQGRPLRTLDEPTREVLARTRPGAAVLFGENFGDAEQVRGLVGELHAALTVAPFIATDYEGGLVSRLTTTGGIPATQIPPAAVVGRAVAAAGGSAAANSPNAGDASGPQGEDGTTAAGPAGPGLADSRPEDPGLALARELGEVMGRELRALGVTMNFAPVADVNPPGGVGAMGRHGRVYGDDPELAGAVAGAVARGLEAAGVAAVVKHFPGHGGVLEDSHLELPTLERSRQELVERDLRAFSRALESAPAGIMTAHLRVPAVDPTGTPASLSPAVTDLAREELGFAGLIVTDALNMRALTDLAPEPELVVRAVEAGADLVLKPLDPPAAHAAILDALEAGRISRGRLEESVRRIFHAKHALGMLPTPLRSRNAVPWVGSANRILGSPRHRELVERIIELAGGDIEEPGS